MSLLSRHATSLLNKFNDAHYLAHFADSLPRLPVYLELKSSILAERRQFKGTAHDYICMLSEQLNRTFEKLSSVVVKTHCGRKGGPEFIPGFFSQTDEIILRSLIKKFEDAKTLDDLMRPLPDTAQEIFYRDMCDSDYKDLSDFSGSTWAYIVLQLTHLHVAVAEVLAYNKYAPRHHVR